MNREKTISQLEQQNGTCDCVELRSLFVKLKRAKKLDTRCQEYLNESEGKEENLGFLELYRDGIEEFSIAVEVYEDSLREHLDSGDLVLKKQGNFKTYHCARCEQQVDYEFY